MEIAKAHAEGLRNLNPKIWNFTSGGKESDSIATVQGLMKLLPGGLEMLKEYNLLSKKPQTE